MRIPIDETALPLVAAVEAATERRPHLSTVLRWSQRRNRYGIKLESWLIGGRRVTSVEAVRRYCERCTEAADGVPSSTAAQRSKAHADAQRELDREFASP